VILLLVLIGLPFREDIDGWQAPALPAAPPARPARTLPVALVVVAVAALGPLLSFVLHRAADAAVAPAAPLLAGGTCKVLDAALPPPPALVAVSGAARIGQQWLSCDGLGVRVVVERFSPRSDPGPILLAERHLSGRIGAEDVVTAKLRAGGLVWTVLETSVPTHTTAFLLWQDGKQRRTDLPFRLRQGIASVIGGTPAPLLVAVAPDPDPSRQGEAGRQQALAAIAAWLRAHPQLPAALDRLALGKQ
jgi:hypothetical protein